MSINLKNVKSATGLLVNDDYMMEISEGVRYESKSKTPGIRFVFRIAEGEFSGRKVKKEYWLTEDSYPFLVRLLNAVHIDSNREFKDADAIIQECIGKKLIGKVFMRNGFPELDDTLPINHH